MSDSTDAFRAMLREAILDATTDQLQRAALVLLPNVKTVSTRKNSITMTSRTSYSSDIANDGDLGATACSSTTSQSWPGCSDSST